MFRQRWDLGVLWQIAWVLVTIQMGSGLVWAHGPLHGQIRLLDQEITQQPDCPELLVKRAELHRLDGNLTNALADLGAAEKLEPTLEGVWWVRSRLLVDQRHPADALPDLNRWLERHPRHVDALTVRARARAQTQDLGGAVTDYTRAIAATDKPDPDLYLARAHAQRQRGPEQFAAALHGLDEGIARLGSLVTLQLEAIDLELALGRTDGALARLDTLTAQAARKETWLARRAELLDRASRPQEARKAWQQAWEACVALPSRLRETRSTKALEERISRHLSPALIAETKHRTKPASDQRPATTALLRTIPAHESPIR